jgi:hypothetical protein
MNCFSKLTDIFSLMNKGWLLLVCCLFAVAALSQPSLPHFAMRTTKQKNIKLSWRNPHRNCVQLLIQRSIDNQKTFTTIRSATHPDMDENDYIDKNIPANTTPYYRISYTLRGGKTIFTKAQALHDKKLGTAEIIEVPKKTTPIISPTKSANPQPLHVTVHPKGYVLIQLPAIDKHHYSMLIYDTDSTVLFNLTEITTSALILEKGNFMRAGWFNYELFEDEQLIEKNKFYLEEENH